MRDLTQGSITRHLFGMAAFIAVGLIVQTLYLLVDLYFVAHLGADAVAGVASAGTSTFLSMAVGQLVAVGALALIAQAIGRKDIGDAQAVLDQALSLSLLGAGLALVIGYTVGLRAIGGIAAAPAAGEAGRLYLAAFIPSLAIMFPMGALGSALRAAGVAGPPMLIQSGTVLINVVLAPVLIAGWATGRPLGTFGAGLASTIAAVVGLLLTAGLFTRMQSRLTLRWSRLRPAWATWKRILAIGFPSAAEFLLMFIVMSVVFWVIRHFGAAAQAGFGIAQRVMQSIFLPAIAIAFAVAPVAGQNFGARRADRVRATFRSAAVIGSLVMFVLSVLCRLAPEVLVGGFSSDPAVIAVGAEYLRYVSFNFIASGLTFATSGMFQAFGDTRPSLVGSGSRILTFVVPAIVMSEIGGFALHDYWRLSVASTWLQAIITLLMLRHHMRRKLDFTDQAQVMPAPTA